MPFSVSPFSSPLNFKMHWTWDSTIWYAEKKKAKDMKRAIRLLTGAIASIFVAASPLTAFAGWEQSGDTYRYRQENNSYAASQWICEDGVYYYLDQNGQMFSNTTTPDGYLTAADGSWVTEKQVLGNYVRTPYDNRPYRYDPEWRIYVFDETTDYAWVTDTKVLAAVRGIIPVSELSEKYQAVYEEVCKFLTGFDYGASEYDKAARIYDEITTRAVYNRDHYTQTDDEVYGILINGTGKCVGFARTYKLLANAVGLKCEFRENGAHMWNAVYVGGEAKSIDTSGTRTGAEFYLGTTVVMCPVCGQRNVFGLRETSHPCPNCRTQLDNPKYN